MASTGAGIGVDSGSGTHGLSVEGGIVRLHFSQRTSLVGDHDDGAAGAHRAAGATGLGR